MSARLAATVSELGSARTAPFRILVVDDEAAHRTVMRDLFSGEDYEVYEVSRLDHALETVSSQRFDVVLVDYYLPDGTGSTLCRAIRRDARHKLLPLLVITGAASVVTLVECLRAGATDVIRKPYSIVELEARVRAAALHKRALDGLDDAEAVLFSIARALELRNAAVGHRDGPIDRLCDTFGLALGLSASEREALRRGAVLHDIGTVSVPDAILTKGGPLEPAEAQILHRHPIVGAEICSRLRTLGRAVDVIRSHRERYDGSGYPDGLAGEAIPYLARVFQVVHAFDALVNANGQRAGMNVPDALSVMMADAQRHQLDPVLVDTFVHLMRSDPALHGVADGPSTPAKFPF